MNAPSPKIVSYIRYLEGIFLAALLLYFGKALFIPLAFAGLLSIILYPVCAWLERKGIYRSVAIAICLIMGSLFVGSLVFIMGWQVIQFKNEVPQLAGKLVSALDQLQQEILHRFNISLQQQVAWFEQTFMNLGNTIGSVLIGTVDATLQALFFVVMVPLLAALMLYNRGLLVHSLYALFPKNARPLLLSVVQKTILVYHNYVKGLLIIYLIVAVLNTIGLYMIGIKHAMLYGILASILTIIPYIGITIGSMLPVTIAWLTFDSIWYPVGVILLFAFVQYLEANILFPWIIGKRLKVNTLASLSAMILGGIIWGASGMVLFLPFVAILKLIAEKIPSWKALDILLGTGEPTSSSQPIQATILKEDAKEKNRPPVADLH
ncbi:AI-2E family transporter [Rhodocytophaga aerolata]|uniref:AI-2E family transporter n=1 Tax=Rhodocytophaga aerolata TaxID=455078 RepID=A0ABT8R4D8_9BACT|nr:AI-2E family transporter [Rhodocytophaga aerolata]MDO1446546.1 AI-2E family transporter [Rhodocytophaga aerolata]